MDQPTNGTKPQAQAQEQIMIGPNDKSILIMLDPVAGAIKTCPINITDQIESANILLAALSSVIAQLKLERDAAAPSLIKLPPGSRLRG